MRFPNVFVFPFRIVYSFSSLEISLKSHSTLELRSKLNELCPRTITNKEKVEWKEDKPLLFKPHSKLMNMWSSKFKVDRNEKLLEKLFLDRNWWCKCSWVKSTQNSVCYRRKKEIGLNWINVLLKLYKKLELKIVHSQKKYDDK